VICINRTALGFILVIISFVAFVFLKQVEVVSPTGYAFGVTFGLFGLLIGLALAVPPFIFLMRREVFGKEDRLERLAERALGKTLATYGDRIRASLGKPEEYSVARRTATAALRELSYLTDDPVERYEALHRVGKLMIDRYPEARRTMGGAFYGERK